MTLAGGLGVDEWSELDQFYRIITHRIDHPYCKHNIIPISLLHNREDNEFGAALRALPRLGSEFLDSPHWSINGISDNGQCSNKWSQIENYVCGITTLS